ncbi:aminotransferase class I/II-fold pyridoxal phosphate-dependent enzyme, partial [Frankia sp. CcWB2]
MCNPHNPTGRVFTESELRAVLRLAERHLAVVISDEVHAPLVYAGREHVPIASLPGAAATSSVTAMSASKGWNISGLQCALAVPGSPADHERLMGMRPRDRDGVGILGVEGSVAAFAGGDLWLRRTMRYLEGNQRILADLLGCFGSDVTHHASDGTYLAWLDCRRMADRLGIADLGQFFLDVGKAAVSDGRLYG